MSIAYNLGMENKYDALVLFSGGLDSLLAAKILQEQGLKILCLHFISPFFGHEDKIKHWEDCWNLNIRYVDISLDFCKMLINTPKHGFGSAINPCVDCKIMILSKAKELLPVYGAKFLATGEVLGQRPMSQRRDSMDLIQNKAQVKGLLLRPLCALHLTPTPLEESGLVKRELLGSIQGRGRNEQLLLAEKYALKEIPAPAGGCILTEKENARRFWQIIKRLRQRENTDEEILGDFLLGRVGRQFWLEDGAERLWLCVGRHKEDNHVLRLMAKDNDVTLKLCDFSGPTGLAREGIYWREENLKKAASILASYSRDASKSDFVRVSMMNAKWKKIISVKTNNKVNFSQLPEWEKVKLEIKQERKIIEKNNEK